MIPEIGHFLIILALWVSIAQTLICFGGAVRSSSRLIAFPRYSSYVIFLLTLAGFCCLATSFLVDDFSINFCGTILVVWKFKRNVFGKT